MLSNINFMGKFNPKINLKNLDTPKIAGYTATGMGVTVPIADCFVKNNEVDKMSQEITQEDINKRIYDIHFDGIVLPEYSRTEKEANEWNIANTITKYYDGNNTLRMVTETSPSGLLLQTTMYNEDGWRTNSAHTEATTNGYFLVNTAQFDGSDEEVLLKHAKKKISYKDLSEI